MRQIQRLPSYSPSKTPAQTTDALVQAASGAPGCIGARMTGAGFGGCAIAFVRRDAVTDFIRAAGPRYTGMTGLAADFYESGLEDGVREIN